MSGLKTQPHDGDVEAFLATLSPDRQEDCAVLVELMQQFTKQPPRMWGDSIVGFGSYHYRYASGREGDWFLVGFSPRRQAISLYLLGDFPERADLLQRLGNPKTGKACVYVKSVRDLHLPTLKSLIRRSVQATRKMDVRD